MLPKFVLNKHLVVFPLAIEILLFVAFTYPHLVLLKSIKLIFFSFIALALQHSTHSFITCSDYMFPSVSWSNNNHDLCYFSQRGSQHLCVPEFLALNGFF